MNFRYILSMSISTLMNPPESWLNLLSPVSSTPSFSVFEPAPLVINLVKLALL